VDKALQQSSKNDNIKSRFRVSWIWPLNLVAMVGKFVPSDMLTSVQEEDLDHNSKNLGVFVKVLQEVQIYVSFMKTKI
jgi:hypothetical protein